MKPILKVIVPLLILAAGIAVFILFKATKPGQAAAKIAERVWRVDVMQVQPRIQAPTLTLYGKLEAPSLLKGAAPGNARVDKVLVREGDRVARGQLLIALDQRDFLPGLEQARAELAELEAQIQSEQIRQQSDLSALQQERKLVQLSEQAVARALRLHKRDLGSDSALDQAEQDLANQTLSFNRRELSIADHPARLAALNARLSSARARLEEVALEQERSQLYAPFDGMVASVNVSERDQVKENDILLTLYDPGTLEVRARIPAPFQEEFDQLLADDSRLQGTAMVGNREVPLQLLRLAGEASPNGTDALFGFAEEIRWLRPGQVLRFMVRRRPRKDTIAVPFSAVYGGKRAYKLDDGRMRGIEVESLGTIRDQPGEEKLLIRSPRLQSGDRLVVTHLPNAVDGLRIEVAPGE